MRRIWLPLLVILTLVLGGYLFAGCKDSLGCHGDPKLMVGILKLHVDSELDKIEATDEQKNKIHHIFGQLVDDAQSVHSKSEEEHGKLLANLLSDTPDSEALHQLVDEKSNDYKEFFHRTVDRLLEINAILTPEQRIALKKKLEKAHCDTQS